MIFDGAAIRPEWSKVQDVSLARKRLQNVAILAISAKLYFITK